MSVTSYHESQTCDMDSLVPQPGFGFEFDILLEQMLNVHQEQADACLKRCGRFWMTREDAMRASPEVYRQQYEDLLKHVFMEETRPTSQISSLDAQLQQYKGGRTWTSSGQQDELNASDGNETEQAHAGQLKGKNIEVFLLLQLLAWLILRSM